jgi:hypothetical protein
MASRVGLVGLLALGACVIAGLASGRPQSPSPLYTVRVDPRLCPSPTCGGYWVALANGARTRCADGTTRGRCYVAKAVLASGGAARVEDGALVRGSLTQYAFDGVRLAALDVVAVFAPAGAASVSGGYYRVVDTGIRCVRAPCFSLRATQVNGSTRTTVSSLDLRASGASSAAIARAERAVATKDGLLARGRFARTADGGRMFRALRLYLRAPQPRA